MSKEKKVNSLSEEELGKVAGGLDPNREKPGHPNYVGNSKPKQDYPGPVGHEGQRGYSEFTKKQEEALKKKFLNKK